MTDVALIAGVLALVAAFRHRIATLPITSPMIFVAAGLLLGSDALGWLSIDLESESVALLAEFTLALLLFSDASRIDVRRLRASAQVPARLLLIGLPLTVAMGTLVTALLLTDLSWPEAALVAAILAPTDAALGEAVVTNTAVPARVRQALNVESGLNDGLVVPVVAVFTSLAAGLELDEPREFVGEALTEIGLGLLVGVAAAFALAKIATVAMRYDWSDAEGYRLLMLGGAVVGYAGAGAAGGNGFIAAFVCGLLVRAFMGEPVDEQTELAEDAGQIGAAATFMVFGALLVWPALEELTVAVALCAIGTLTIGRMLPVWVALLGSGLRLRTVAFIGWFGPRGLASMVFGLLLFQEESLESPDDLFSVIVLVIIASVVLHGATAAPMSRRYAEWFREQERHDMEEAMPVDAPMARGERVD
ncbi:cation:proton antiporter [Ilumatobacter sp.]|uniref:cation:proton antiporter n=1 Tax=Ilumatobacter sp. TaxID=1967498 RepID=UPI003AF497A0